MVTKKQPRGAPRGSINAASNGTRIDRRRHRTHDRLAPARHLICHATRRATRRAIRLSLSALNRLVRRSKSFLRLARSRVVTRTCEHAMLLLWRGPQPRRTPGKRQSRQRMRDSPGSTDLSLISLASFARISTSESHLPAAQVPRRPARRQTVTPEAALIPALRPTCPISVVRCKLAHHQPIPLETWLACLRGAPVHAPTQFARRGGATHRPSGEDCAPALRQPGNQAVGP